METSKLIKKKDGKRFENSLNFENDDCVRMSALVVPVGLVTAGTGSTGGSGSFSSSEENSCSVDSVVLHLGVDFGG